MKLAIQIEDLTYEAEALRSLLLAVYNAIYNSTDNYEEYNFALDAVFRMAHDHMEHMKSLMDKAYAIQREVIGRQKQGADY